MGAPAGELSGAEDSRSPLDNSRALSTQPQRAAESDWRGGSSRARCAHSLLAGRPPSPVAPLPPLPPCRLSATVHLLQTQMRRTDVARRTPTALPVRAPDEDGEWLAAEQGWMAAAPAAAGRVEGITVVDDLAQEQAAQRLESQHDDDEEQQQQKQLQEQQRRRQAQRQKSLPGVQAGLMSLSVRLPCLHADASCSDIVPGGTGILLMRVFTVFCRISLGHGRFEGHAVAGSAAPRGQAAAGHSCTAAAAGPGQAAAAAQGAAGAVARRGRAGAAGKGAGVEWARVPAGCSVPLPRYHPLRGLCCCRTLCRCAGWPC